MLYKTASGGATTERDKASETACSDLLVLTFEIHAASRLISREQQKVETLGEIGKKCLQALRKMRMYVDELRALLAELDEMEAESDDEDYSADGSSKED